MLHPCTQACAAALLRDSVPDAWDRVWEGPDNPTDYCRAAVSRAASIESFWVPRFLSTPTISSSTSSGTGGVLSLEQWRSTPLDLHQLFRPAALLNALRQQAARTSGAALDALRLAATCDVRRLPTGVLAVPLAGVMLQGAAFDGERLSALMQVRGRRGGGG